MKNMSGQASLRGVRSTPKQSPTTAPVAQIASAATDLGFTRDRRLIVRKSGKPDLRGRLAMTRHRYFPFFQSS
jgi:hypothetical protein